MTTLLARYAERRCIWRYRKAALVRWRRLVSSLQAAGARPLRMASCDERFGIAQPCPTLDAARRDRLASADPNGGSADVERVGFSPVFMPFFRF
jgi:hypothetical protein